MLESTTDVSHPCDADSFECSQVTFVYNNTMCETRRTFFACRVVLREYMIGFTWMHAVGLHSALAIKRQRKRRDEQRRARERRYSSQSGESGLTSPRASTASLDQHVRNQRKTNTRKTRSQGMVDSKVVTSIGMLHIGVVFLVLGAFLFLSGLLPSDFTSWGAKGSIRWWNELVAIGIFSILVGCFLIILNRVIAKKEENDLEKYVQRQLTRSKSGHRLERDVETGGLTTKHAKRAKQLKIQETNNILNHYEPEQASPTTSPKTYSIYQSQDDHLTMQTKLFLEQIQEEDVTLDRLETLSSVMKSSSPIKEKLLLKNTLNLNKNCGIQHHHPQCIEVSKI
ncbi:uncharacterized protein LOC100117714 [Nasonia vitripennis]|uniref:Uncharacterized protein n=1 Tax=Nasonia vitripennis TaxID=7425 RepID=A0A7M7QLB3_NASVI|nr:uncharacterized protein LOC100117714 [Nasonia vitripennis]